MLAHRLRRAAGVGQRSDPLWANVELLLHFDGADGSTTFTDSSVNNFAATVTGNAQIDTAQSVFGGASFLSDGSGDRISYASNALLSPGSADFCLEFWLRFSAFSPGVDGYRVFHTAVSGGFVLHFEGGGLKISRHAVADVLTYTWVPVTDRWYAICAERSSGRIRLMVDGAMVADAADATSFATGAVSLMGSSTPVSSTPGWMDELRYTEGVGRYGGSYTVSNLPFPNQ